MADTPRDDAIAQWAKDALGLRFANPALLRQAVLRLACRWFEHRGDVVSRDAARLPAEIAALVAPFRRARL